MAKDKKEPTTVEDLISTAPLITTEIDLDDLFDRLKEFDNNLLLERVKVLERTVTLLYKQMLNNQAILQEIQENMAYLSVAQEELLNSMGYTTTNEPPLAEESNMTTAIAHTGKKQWN